MRRTEPLPLSVATGDRRHFFETDPVRTALPCRVARHTSLSRGRARTSWTRAGVTPVIPSRCTSNGVCEHRGARLRAR